MPFISGANGWLSWVITACTIGFLMFWATQLPQESHWWSLVVKPVVHFGEFTLSLLRSWVISGHAAAHGCDRSARCVCDPVPAVSASPARWPAELYPGPGCCRVSQVEARGWRQSDPALGAERSSRCSRRDTCQGAKGWTLGRVKFASSHFCFTKPTRDPQKTRQLEFKRIRASTL